MHKIIDGCFQLGGEVLKRAKEALRLLGQESRINALRVTKYGVKVDPVGGGSGPDH